MIDSPVCSAISFSVTGDPWVFGIFLAVELLALTVRLVYPRPLPLSSAFPAAEGPRRMLILCFLLIV